LEAREPLGGQGIFGIPRTCGNERAQRTMRARQIMQIRKFLKLCKLENYAIRKLCKLENYAN
jgi:hypothetical protein